MQITFHGAVREVTGSMHLITTEHDQILMDCGIFQGRRKESREKNRIMPVDPRLVSNVVLSHAHIDHCGRIPVLTQRNFPGRVICTRATADACQYLLMDAGHIQESDAAYLNYKTVRSALLKGAGKSVSAKKRAEIQKKLKKDRHRLDSAAIDRIIREHRIEAVKPLYTQVEAEAALKCFDGFPYRHPVAVGRDTTCTFYDAGHILGSAISVIKVRENGRTKTICYTGDLGRFGKPIIKDPVLEFAVEDSDIDLLVMESTYGNRLHEPVVDLKPRLKSIITETKARNGCILIPSFAFGRTQELLYVLHELYNEGEVPRLPVYIDSPLATRLTRVFGEHPEVYDSETHETFLQKGQNPFSFPQIRFVQSVQESMALNRDETPHIVIAGAGMCEAGRILHHLRHKIHNPHHTILTVGYMAQHTLGRRILEHGLAYAASGRKGDPPLLRFMNKTYPLKAQVVKLGGFSGHADRNEMLKFLECSNLRVKQIAVVHGEEDQALAWADHLRHAGHAVTVPRTGESITIS